MLWQSTQELRDGSIILFMGYGTGVQCWLLPITGLAYEVFSQRRGTYAFILFILKIQKQSSRLLW